MPTVGEKTMPTVGEKTMPTVQAFDYSMIERFVRSKNWKFLRDNDGDFRVEFAYDQDTGCEMTVWLMAGGSKHNVYTVLVTADKHIAKSDWGRAIMLCNTWNKEKRWPKAFLHVRDPNSDTIGAIRLEGQIDLEQGIHQELFDDFTLTIISGANTFWEWAHKEQNL